MYRTFILLLLLAGAPFPQSSQAQAPQRDGHEAMITALKKVERIKNDLPFVGAGKIYEIENYLSEGAVKGIVKNDLFIALMELAREQNHQGFPAEALINLNQAFDIAKSEKNSERAEFAAMVELAHFYLRKAETENCCSRYTSESCILPLQGQAIHTKTEGSRKAIQLFESALSLHREQNWLRKEVYYETIWLLNIAYMTLGEYPELVPAAYLIPPESFEAKSSFPRFANVSESLGLARESMAGGVVADDFDGDHDIDIVVTSWEPGGTMAIYENTETDGFRERAVEAGLTGITGGINIIQADYDNDGDVDLFIPRGGWMSEMGKQPNSLLQNDGKGNFRDVAFDAGLGEAFYPTQTAAWADYDLDGFVDLFVGNENKSTVAPCQLFRNQGDGTFVDLALEAGVTNDRFTKGVIWTDVNNDRYPDLVVSNLNESNRLYINLGNGKFEDRAESAGVTGPNSSFPLWSWDVNNDGNRDIFINSYTGGTHVEAMRALGLDPKAEASGMFQGNGDGTFRNVSASFGLDFSTLTMGCNVGDLNNDGFEDCYLGTGKPQLMSIVPNRLLINQGGKEFIDVTMASGMGHLQKGHGVAFADFDRDGDLDIFEQLGGAITIDVYRDAYFENPGFPGGWVQIKAVGTRSNRSAIGTRIRLKIRSSSGTREIHREINSGGSFGSNPLLQHIGLGDAEEIMEMELFWPAGNETQVFKNVPLRVQLMATEGNSELKIIDKNQFDH